MIETNFVVHIVHDLHVRGSENRKSQKAVGHYCVIIDKHKARKAKNQNPANS